MLRKGGWIPLHRSSAEILPLIDDNENTRHKFKRRRRWVFARRRRGITCFRDYHRIVWLFLFTICVFVALFIATCITLAIFLPIYSKYPAHYLALAQNVHSSTALGRGNPANEKVFIAANIVDGKMVEGAWGQAIKNLVEMLGPDNVFVSIYENDGGLTVRDALLTLGTQLTCNKSIVTGAKINLSGFPKILLPSGKLAVDRIEYLAYVRNQALLPLDLDTQNAAESTFNPGFRTVHPDVSFDKILFLNDVYFSPLDAVHLLFSTNQVPRGARSRSDVLEPVTRTPYHAACAIDFVSLVNFYDHFVARDSVGNLLDYVPGFHLFPWFERGSRSRKEVLQGYDAVNVRSCWGGMVAFDASLFQQPSERRTPKAHDRQGVGKRSTPQTTDGASEKEQTCNIPGNCQQAGAQHATTSHLHDLGARHLPLVDHEYLSDGPIVRFRATHEPFWIASECCLLHADIAHKVQQRSSHFDTEPRIYMNPYIRVAYEINTFRWLGTLKRVEHALLPVQWLVSFFLARDEHLERRDEVPNSTSRRKIWVWQDEKLSRRDRQPESKNISANNTNSMRRAVLPRAEPLTGSYEFMDVHVEAPGGFCGLRGMAYMRTSFARRNQKGTDNWKGIAAPA